MRAHVVDPSAFTPPYDHALCAALAAQGVEVELITSAFAYGAVPEPEGYARRERFYRHAVGPAGSRTRRVAKLLEHVPDMLAYRRLARRADVVHFQWLDVQWLDGALLPRRPLVLTAHDLLPREARAGQASAQRRLLERMDAVIAHSGYGRDQLVGTLGLDPGRVHVVPHGAFEHLTRQTGERPLPAELAAVEGPVVLFFGLLRPYKGLATLLRAWRQVQVPGAELWVVGRPRMPLEPLRAQASPGVRFIPRFISDGELPAYFRRAQLVVLPYERTERLDQSGVLATALAFGRASVLSDVGSFPEIAAASAARVVPSGDAGALAAVLSELLGDDDARLALEAGARAAAAGRYSWTHAARATRSVYQGLLSAQSGA